LLLFRFLGKLLNVWGSASAIGLQALLERLQAVSMGVWLAPQQLQRYRAVAHSVDWASLGWAGELGPGALTSLCPVVPAVQLSSGVPAPAPAGNLSEQVQPSLALKLVLAMGYLMGALIALHFVAALTWQALPCTRHHPLPPFLTSPVPELLLANALVLPLAMASTILMAAVEPQKRVLGATGMLALACYFGLVAAVLLALARRQQQLGLTYTRLDKSPETGIKLARPSRWPGANRGKGQGATTAMASPFQNVPSSKCQLGFSARVLLQFSPPQAHGYWSQADVAVQQQLRHTYHGGVLKAGLGYLQPWVGKLV
jgi:hypothetical protein